MNLALQTFFFFDGRLRAPTPPANRFRGASSWGPFVRYRRFLEVGTTPTLSGGVYMPIFRPRRGR